MRYQITTISDGIKICLAASAGGHLSQLLSLADCWAGKDIFFVTTMEVVRPNGTFQKPFEDSFSTGGR